MFDFSEVLTPHIERFRPHAEGWGLELRGFGHRILQLLQDIDENTRDTDFISDRVFPSVNFNPTTTPTIVAFVVPAAEDWELESVRTAADGAGNFALVRNSNPAPTDPAFARGTTGPFPTANGNQNGMGVMIPGGTTVYITYGGAPATNLSIECQIRRRFRKPAERGVSGVRATPTDGDESTPNPDKGRHTGTWHARGVV